MTTRSKIRLTIATAITLLVVVFVAWLLFAKAKEEGDGITAQKPTTVVPIKNNRRLDWNPGEDHPLVQPTDFYTATNTESTEGEEVRDQPLPNYERERVSRDSVLTIRLLHEGDLLADCWYAAVQENISQEQLREARAIAKQYDARLKELRRQRAEILEHAGVTVKDPEEALRENGIRFSKLFAEVKLDFNKRILTAEQRKLVHEKFRLRRLARARKQENEKLAKPDAKVR